MKRKIWYYTRILLLPTLVVGYAVYREGLVVLEGLGIIVVLTFLAILALLTIVEGVPKDEGF